MARNETAALDLFADIFTPSGNTQRDVQHGVGFLKLYRDHPEVLNAKQINATCSDERVSVTAIDATGETIASGNYPLC